MWKKYLKQLSLPESYISITLGFLVVLVAGLLIYNNFAKLKQLTSSTQETKLEEKKGEEVAILPTTHTVNLGENLWRVAEKYYGSGYNWVTLASENKISNPDVIVVGQVLTIPKAEVIRPEGEKMLAAATEPEKTYTVLQGDNLWNIAVQEYSDGFAWPKIVDANHLANPDLIHAGNVLKLPK